MLGFAVHEFGQARFKNHSLFVSRLERGSLFFRLS
jgi:hypothetical protein